MAKIKEIWKDIDGYEGKYRVSNLGRIKSLDRIVNHAVSGYTKKHTGRIIKCGYVSGGYLRVMFGDRKSELVHRLVAKAFIKNPKNKPCVNHLDGDKTNNKKGNLQWCTYSENEFHSYKSLGKEAPRPWLGKRGKLNPFSKVVNQYNLDGKLIRTHESSQLAADFVKLNVNPKASRGTIWSAITGKYKTAYGFVWEYAKEKRVAQYRIENLKEAKKLSGKNVN